MTLPYIILIVFNLKWRNPAGYASLYNESCAKEKVCHLVIIWLSHDYFIALHKISSNNRGKYVS